MLSVFVGTFVYSAAGLFDVGIAGGRRVDEFPRFAVTVAIVLMFLSLALLVFFADHLAHSLQVDQIMRTVERNTLRRDPRRCPPAAGAAHVPDDATPVPPRSGYVQYVDRAAPGADAARATALNVRLRPRVGEHVAAGTPLAVVWPVSDGGAPPPPSPTRRRRLHAPVRIGFERTLEQDPSLGMRQLVDTACKALSPAVNDPYTAIQAVAPPLGRCTPNWPAAASGRSSSRATGATVASPPARSPSTSTSGMGLIRRYGAGEPTVIHALLSALTAVLLAAPDDGEPGRAVEHQADLLVRAAERHVDEPGDLRAVLGGERGASTPARRARPAPGIVPASVLSIRLEGHGRSSAPSRRCSAGEAPALVADPTGRHAGPVLSLTTSWSAARPRRRAADSAPGALDGPSSPRRRTSGTCSWSTVTSGSPRLNRQFAAVVSGSQA